mmetsp:Transcript_24223/g.50616  ORF Transcript_24223/g.50616 Transcript_24223/m.50616 type:complete len:407 (+) Transcript_24223:170-1390(+)
MLHFHSIFPMMTSTTTGIDHSRHAPPSPHPHDIPFSYDEDLLSSCAVFASSLRRRQLLHDDNVDDKNNNRHDDDATTTTTTNPDADANDTSSSSIPNQHRRDCRELFERHARHYDRPPPSRAETAFWDSDPPAAAPSPRIVRFLTSVSFVRDHDSEPTDRNARHRVALNRFSDLSPAELPLMTRDALSVSWEDLPPLSEGAGALPPFVRLNDDDDEEEGEDVVARVGELARRRARERRRRRGRRRAERTTPPDRPSAATALGPLLASDVWSRAREAWWWIGGERFRFDDDGTEAKGGGRNRNLPPTFDSSSHRDRADAPPRRRRHGRYESSSSSSSSSSSASSCRSRAWPSCRRWRERTNRWDRLGSESRGRCPPKWQQRWWGERRVLRRGRHRHRGGDRRRRSRK